jgi:hypothetical protein
VVARKRLPSGAPIICEIGRRSAWFWGPWKAIDTAITATGAPSMRCPKKRTVTVPIGYADDVLSHLDYAQRRTVELRMVDR